MPAVEFCAECLLKVQRDGRCKEGCHRGLRRELEGMVRSALERHEEGMAELRRDAGAWRGLVEALELPEQADNTVVHEFVMNARQERRQALAALELLGCKGKDAEDVEGWARRHLAALPYGGRLADAIAEVMDLRSHLDWWRKEVGERFTMSSSFGGELCDMKGLKLYTNRCRDHAVEALRILGWDQQDDPEAWARQQRSSRLGELAIERAAAAEIIAIDLNRRAEELAQSVMTAEQQTRITTMRSIASDIREEYRDRPCGGSGVAAEVDRLQQQVRAMQNKCAELCAWQTWAITEHGISSTMNDDAMRQRLGTILGDMRELQAEMSSIRESVLAIAGQLGVKAKEHYQTKDILEDCRGVLGAITLDEERAEARLRQLADILGLHYDAMEIEAATLRKKYDEATAVLQVELDRRDVDAMLSDERHRTAALVSENVTLRRSIIAAGAASGLCDAEESSSRAEVIAERIAEACRRRCRHCGGTRAVAERSVAEKANIERIAVRLLLQGRATSAVTVESTLTMLAAAGLLEHASRVEGIEGDGYLFDVKTKHGAVLKVAGGHAVVVDGGEG